MSKRLITPEYNRRAIERYKAKKDNVSVLLPLGTKDKVKQLTGESMNGFINRLVLAELSRIERETDHVQDQKSE